MEDQYSKEAVGSATGSPLRDRGLLAVADTTAVAEHDIKGYQISDSILSNIAENLCKVTHSPRDRVVGDIRIRLLFGYDIIFTISREPKYIVVTIAGVRPPDPKNPTEELLKRLGSLAVVRGATGL